MPGRSYPIFVEPRGVGLTEDNSGAPRLDRATQVVFVHGWNADSASMGGLWRALLQAPEAENCRFWNVDYPTHRWSFARGAKEIATALHATGADFSDTILIGFSMGGVTARQMVADGFPCRALFAIGSPHQGITRWVPTHSPGTASIHRQSRALRALNSNPIDIAARERYYFYSITYSDRLGKHPHDGLVSKRSALGSRLGKLAHRQNFHYEYEGVVAYHGPHLRGMSAKYMAPVVERVRGLMR